MQVMVLLRLASAMLLLGTGFACAQPDRNQVGWSFFRGAPGAATLVYDECATCSGETAVFRASCTRSGLASVTIVFANAVERAPRAVGRSLPVTLQAGSARAAAAGRADDYQGSLAVEVPIRSDDPVFAAMAGTPSLRVSSPVAAFEISLRTAPRAVAGWRAACGVAPAVSQAPAAPTGPLQRYVGTYKHAELLREPQVASALAALMPAQALQLFRRQFEVTGPIQSEAGILVLSGGVAQAADRFASVLTIAADNSVEAGLLSDGRLTIYGKGTREALTAPMRTWIAERGAIPIRFHAAGMR